MFRTEKLTVTGSPGSTAPLAGLQVSATREHPPLIGSVAGAGSIPAIDMTPVLSGSSQSDKRSAAEAPLFQATENLP